MQDDCSGCYEKVGGIASKSMIGRELRFDLYPGGCRNLRSSSDDSNNPAPTAFRKTDECSPAFTIVEGSTAIPLRLLSQRAGSDSADSGLVVCMVAGFSSGLLPALLSGPGSSMRLAEDAAHAIQDHRLGHSIEITTSPPAVGCRCRTRRFRTAAKSASRSA